MQLRANGHEVYGFGERKTPSPFVNACTTFLYPRNYGTRNFPALFEATGLFEIVKGEGGHSFVADKRNKDRAAKPAP